jgi:hypothetical protein
LLGEGLAEIGLWAEWAACAHHGAADARSVRRRVHIVIHLVVGECRIDVLIDDVQNDRHVYGMAGVDESAQAVRAAEVGTGRKVVERAVAPVEVQLDAADGQQFEAIDANALQIGEAIDDAVEGVVKLLDLEFVNDQVVELGCSIGGVGPDERRRIASEQDGGEKSNISLEREGIGEPARHELALAASRREPKLVAIKIEAFRAEMRADNWLNGNGGAPEIERMTVVPEEMRILRLNGGVEAVVAVNYSHNEIETVSSANSREVDSEGDLESAGDRNGKRSDFGNVDHEKYDSCGLARGSIKFLLTMEVYL